MSFWHYLAAVAIGLVVFDALIVALLAYAARQRAPGDQPGDQRSAEIRA